jgi:hypothetical protein
MGVPSPLPLRATHRLELPHRDHLDLDGRAES